MESPKRQPEAKDGYFLDRKDLIAFSDAIFAFAITLLAINIRLAGITIDSSTAQVASGISNLLPKLWSFILTFAIGCFYWINYHRIMHFVRKVDGRLVLLNLSSLMFLVLLPFPNDLIGSNPGAISAAIEAFVLACLGLTSGLMWAYASRHGLIEKGLDDRFVRKMTRRLFISPVIFAISIPLAFFIPFYFVAAIWLAIIPLRSLAI